MKSRAQQDSNLQLTDIETLLLYKWRGWRESNSHSPITVLYLEDRADTPPYLKEKFMFINYDSFLKMKTGEKIRIKCDGCQREILRIKKYILERKQNKIDSKHYCGSQCMPRKIGRIEAKCGFCDNQVSRQISQVVKSKSGLIFCSKTCAAKYTNVHFPKRRKVYGQCKDCSTQINRRNIYCPDCFKIRNKVNSDITLGELQDRRRYQKNSQVRDLARKKETVKKAGLKCLNCGYDKHTEVCHIKPIYSYPKNTLVSEVNSDSNLSILCPNCHWEFDNGKLINIKTVKDYLV